ncbi:23S rRNA-intervening sequence protein [Flavobacterium fontis]|uniref:23S rRNA-intervening sequence protein n=2 Tax=Flavobacterium TaxID=237 RepID=A0A1M5ALH6_9FLAO|nr:23S rRNA-intervening sequence protein [Flavobacterium fontis]
MNTYRNLIVWQKAMNLVTTTYEITLEFPKT